MKRSGCGGVECGRYYPVRVDIVQRHTGWPAHETERISNLNEGNTYAVRASRWVNERSRNGVKG